MAKVVLLNKPYDALCQFTDDQGRSTLADYINTPELKGVYAAGRLDRDSEGLVVLTDNGKLQHQIAHPDKKQPKVYWVQIEGDISTEAIALLRKGVLLKDGMTKPAQVEAMTPPNVWERSKPIRERKNQPTSWISIGLTEGKNRQVRRMTAAVGFPTLRLIRFSVGRWSLASAAINTTTATVGDQPLLMPGEYTVETVVPPTQSPKDKNTTPRTQFKNRFKQKRPKTK